ncbi:NfeD family protein [Clavibacter sp. Sh2088]|uniref:NfeD family protein n=1 Tax=Clavibacter sp. Sh2088 TaxID=3397676 RepID=UPI0039DFAAAD
MTVLLDESAWVAWLALIVVLVVVEMRRLDLAALSGGVAALVALLSGLVGAPWWVQVFVALAATVALVGVARPALLRALPIDDPTADDESTAPDAAADRPS